MPGAAGRRTGPNAGDASWYGACSAIVLRGMASVQRRARRRSMVEQSEKASGVGRTTRHENGVPGPGDPPPWGRRQVGEPSRVALSLLRFSAVRARTGLSRSTIRRLERRGQFPPHHQIAPNSVAWIESDIATWIETRTKLSVAS
jgi:prophage regulatory protein